MKTYADSTIGMTVYNVLCIVGRPMTVEDMLGSARMQHAGLQLDDVVRAVAGLLARGRLVEKPGDTYDLASQHRLIVVRRDLGDYDYVTMEGGWEGWQVKDPRIRDGVGTRPLEALLGKPLTGRTPRPLPPPPPTVSVEEETP